MRERTADADCPWVFLVGGKGKRRCEPLGYDALVRMFARAAGRAGVRDAWLTPHSLRHTHATQFSEKGARTQTIMKILGHQSAGMSMTYANISDPVVLADYQSVLQPGAIIAGPLPAPSAPLPGPAAGRRCQRTDMEARSRPTPAHRRPSQRPAGRAR